MELITKFASTNRVLRSNTPLGDDQIRTVAPSIFAEQAHDSRSARYSYIPTSEILRRLQSEGFSPFMVCQSKSRDVSKREHTKHMVRLRHGSQISSDEANEIILVNSHDGSSAYQMLAGVFRFVCSNGMVCGTAINDVRVRHNGDVIDNVIEGAFRVVEDFASIDAQKDEMKSLRLSHGEQLAFAKAARALKYDDPDIPPPITEHQLQLIERDEDNAQTCGRYLIGCKNILSVEAYVVAASTGGASRPGVSMRLTRTCESIVPCGCSPKRCGN